MSVRAAAYTRRPGGTPPAGCTNGTVAIPKLLPFVILAANYHH